MNFRYICIAAFVAVLPLLITFANANAGDLSKESKFIQQVAEDIEGLKLEYSQLDGFSSQKHLNPRRSKIDYMHRTRKSTVRAGWRAGVPEPLPDGI